MEAFVRDQIVATLRDLPFHWSASYLKKRSSPEVEELRRRLGGFIKGICHPNENYGQIKGAGIEWNRADIPFPFEKDGSPREKYLEFKDKMRRYRENGIRIIVIIPNPKHYIAAGIDPRTPEGEARVREIAVFLLEDLRGLVEGFQVANEMGAPRFTRPLNVKEAAHFIGVNLEAMYPRRGDILIGYNSGGPQCDLHAHLRPWHKYCDYIGVDIYIGCFLEAGNWMCAFDGILRYLWSMIGKPIILMEFGYISGGVPKTPEEKRAVLRRYGISSEAEARANLGAFMEKLKEISPKMYDYTVSNASGDYGDFLFQSDYKNHFYCELPRKTVIKKYPHTPQEQADFYRDIYPRLMKLPFVVGAFIYCWSDAERCNYCHQADCPTETRWGLVDLDGREKPSYFAVREALEGIK
jgi:hypothetical protein